MRFTSKDSWVTQAAVYGLFAGAVSPLVHRGLPDSPTRSYAPGEVTCPKGITNFLRTADSVSPDEAAWLKKRAPVTRKAFQEYLKRAKLKDFDVDAFFNANQDWAPKFGLAFSGGGYRAMLNGGGVLKAFDERTTDAKKHVGGILQSATYIAGLSGGSWAIGSVVVNNFTKIEDIQKRDDVWDLETSILAPEGRLAILDSISYYRDLRDEVMSKKEAGYVVTLTDYWGRAIARQILISPKDTGAPATTFSSIADTKEFKDAIMPFPIVVADARNPDETIISSNSTVFEINPLEMGSFDPTLYKFTRTKYVGTSFTDGKVDNATCMAGFDNAGFVLGTSSSLFNAGLLQLNSTGIDGTLRDLAFTILSGLSDSSSDIAAWSPNPFFSTSPLPSQPLTSDRNLTLVDGGMDLQNIPLNPLIQPVRALDTIIAADASADTSNWPNGTALYATYERSVMPQQNGTAFPEIPTVNSFVNLGLNTRPTFFGCAWNESLPQGTAQPSLIVYIPNSPYTFMSNFSTFDRKYTTEDRDAIIDNGYQVATKGEDEEWPACLACAIMHRHWQREGGQTEQCKQCMTEYCWDGKRNDTVPSEPYEPTTTKADAKKSVGFRSGVSLVGVVVGAGLSLLAVM
ncbi:hypothetical protein BJ508DRAFT_308402 [Ascobolus immersus RN42]|uniref:Lysophospholipase n=1 Tax=Ascobolus immersus RN42 TaxID=1160509 RepID=A0A3N4I5N2_ASCIM|nr:hypothetical protein BJ508DRAFT_308402 [Ascobolus immersus RN42]